MKKIALVIGFIAAVAAPLGGAVPAYAASAYDQELQTTSFLHMLNTKYNSTVQTLSLDTILSEYTNGCSPADIANFTLARNNNEPYAISAQDYYEWSTPGTDLWRHSMSVNVIYSRGNPTTPGNLIFTETNGILAPGSVYTNFLRFYLDDGGTKRCSSSPNTSMQISSHRINNGPGEDGLPAAALYYTNWPYNYPAGYEGLPFPSNPDIPHGSTDQKPDISIFTTKQWNVTFADKWYGGLQATGILCDELAPMLNYEIWERNSDNTADVGDAVYTGRTTAASQITADLSAKKSNSNINYRIVAWYDCDGIDNTVDFNGGSTIKDFIMQSNGIVSDTGLITNCNVIGGTGDNLDFGACINYMNSTINSMSFGILGWALPNIFDVTIVECGSIGQLGIWAGYTGTVCPAFSSTLRNIVTPFITVAIGLFILRAMLNKSNQSVV